MAEIEYLEIGERPWGKYYVLIDEPTYKVKKLVILPGKRLSLQSHDQRAEHWVVTEGQGMLEVRVTDNPKDWVKKYKAGQHIFVPLGAIHRISNESNTELVIVEVQTGTYTGEDDITRYEDDFGRV